MLGRKKVERHNELRRYMFDCFYYNTLIDLIRLGDGEIHDEVMAEVERMRERWGVIPEFSPHLSNKKIEAICVNAYSELKKPEEKNVQNFHGGVDNVVGSVPDSGVDHNEMYRDVFAEEGVP